VLQIRLLPRSAWPLWPIAWSCLRTSNCWAPRPKGRILWRMRAVASLPTVANGAPSVLEARASHRLRTAVRTVALPLDVPAGWY